MAVANIREQRQVGLILLASIIVAVKFNQSSQISECLQFSNLTKNIEPECSAIDLASAEIHVLKSLQFRLQITSPYEYNQILFRFITYAQGAQLIKQQVQVMIDFSLSLPDLDIFSAKLLFLSCLFNICGQQLTTQHHKQISMKIGQSDWQLISKIRRIIRKHYLVLLKNEAFEQF